MSTRTLLEINHDMLPKLQNRPDIVLLFLRELGSSMHAAALNEANERGAPLDVGHGLSIVLQRHHTTEISVTTEYAAVKL